MGFTQWEFRWENGGWHRLSSRWFDRFLRGEAQVSESPEGMLTASVPLELDDREPVAIGKPRFDRWPLLPDGTLDRDQAMQATAAILESLPLPSEDNVIHAEGRFARRRLQEAAHWTPTDEQLELLVQAVQKRGAPPRMARLILDQL